MEEGSGGNREEGGRGNWGEEVRKGKRWKTEEEGGNIRKQKWMKSGKGRGWSRMERGRNRK